MLVTHSVLTFPNYGLSRLRTPRCRLLALTPLLASAVVIGVPVLSSMFTPAAVKTFMGLLLMVRSTHAPCDAPPAPLMRVCSRCLACPFPVAGASVAALDVCGGDG